MIHLYPGMGANASMFGPLWRSNVQGEFHNWPEWSGEDSIAEIAAVIIKRDRIRPGDTIIGTSLGGIVACEIANQMKLERLILIGSAKNKSEINGILKALHPLLKLTPLTFLKMSASKIPGDLTQMFSQTDPKFLREMTKAVFNWQGLREDVPTTRIHGKKDLVIPPPEKVDSLLDGGHLIVMTHAKECIDAIQ